MGASIARRYGGAALCVLIPDKSIMRILLHPFNRFQQELIRRFLLAAIEAQVSSTDGEVLKNLTEEEAESLNEMLKELKRSVL